VLCGKNKASGVEETTLKSEKDAVITIFYVCFKIRKDRFFSAIFLYIKK